MPDQGPHHGRRRHHEEVPYPVFRAALDSGNLGRIRQLAARTGTVTLSDALRICLLIRDEDPDRYGRAALRWLSRFATEAPDATDEELHSAAVALEALPDHPDEAMEHLADLCRRHRVA